MLGFIGQEETLYKSNVLQKSSASLSDLCYYTSHREVHDNTWYSPRLMKKYLWCLPRGAQGRGTFLPPCSSSRDLTCPRYASWPLSTWHKPRPTLEEEISVEDVRHKIDRWACLWGIFLIANWYRVAQLIVGNATPG